MQYAWARKSDADHTVEGPVCIPGEIDTEGEVLSAEAILDMAYDWLKNDRALKIDTNHDNILTGCEVVRWFIALKGDPDYVPGTWGAVVRVTPDVWELAQEGDINGFSFGGKKWVTLAIARVEGVRSVTGTTEKSETDGFAEHYHDVPLLEFDVAGRVLPTVTAREMNHWHSITKTTSTNESFKHSHRQLINGV